MTVKGDRYIHLWAKPDGGEWEYIDSADEHNTKQFLYSNYKQAFGPGWSFRWRKSGD